jgi:hypothetical protein
VTEPVVAGSGATGIACADAMPRPTAKAIEAKSFMCFPPRTWKAEFHRNAAEYAMKELIEFSPQCSLSGSAFSKGDSSAMFYFQGHVGPSLLSSRNAVTAKRKPSRNRLRRRQ